MATSSPSIQIFSALFDDMCGFLAARKKFDQFWNGKGLRASWLPGECTGQSDGARIVLRIQMQRGGAEVAEEYGESGAHSLRKAREDAKSTKRENFKLQARALCA